MKIVIDVSVYQNTYTFEQFKLLINNGVAGVIIRAGAAHSEDNMLPTFVSWCRTLYIPYGLYFYVYPGLGIKYQAELFEMLISEYPDCKSVWIDIEEYKNPSSGTTYSPDILNAFYKGVFDYIKAAFPDKIVGNYSGGWVLDSYMKQAWTWINTAPYWNAAYVKYYSWWHNYMNSLGASWDSDLRQISIANLSMIMAEIERHPLVGPAGVVKVSMWQAITFIPFVELSSWQKHLDYNICNDFDLIFGPPAPPPAPVIGEKDYRIDELKWLRLELDKVNAASEAERQAFIKAYSAQADADKALSDLYAYISRRETLLGKK